MSNTNQEENKDEQVARRFVATDEDVVIVRKSQERDETKNGDTEDKSKE